MGWTPDGKSILFMSPRTAYSRFSEMFSVPAEGGVEERLPLREGYEGQVFLVLLLRRTTEHRCVHAGLLLPTEAMRNGDMSGLIYSPNIQQVVYDPWSTDTTTWARQPFAYGGKLNAYCRSNSRWAAIRLVRRTPRCSIRRRPARIP